MTMPEGWLPPERKMTEVEKKEKEEETKLVDYYYQVVKPALNDPSKTEEEKNKIFSEYGQMRGKVEAPRRTPLPSSPPMPAPSSLRAAESSSYRKPSGRSSSDAGAAILIGCFVVGVILLIVTVFTLNFYVLALGGILFLIGVAGLSWGGRGAHDNTSGLFWYTYGSHNAKKNMYRGYRYSKRK